MMLLNLGEVVKNAIKVDEYFFQIFTVWQKKSLHPLTPSKIKPTQKL
tara:strand:+ start:651 stop:791 length:141 start_codon:yes stop_codon:yes gene_type:complete